MGHETPSAFLLSEAETTVLCASLGLRALPSSPLLSCVPWERKTAYFPLHSCSSGSLEITLRLGCSLMAHTVCPVILTVVLLFPQYGEVLNLVLSRKKAGNAIVEFATVRAAVSAVWGLGAAGSPVILSKNPTSWVL